MSLDMSLGGRMNLDMYLKETYSQRDSMNELCIEIIQAMEQVITSINFFLSDNQLKGETYSSAKMFMAQSFRPLAQGMIYLCEELIRQNDKYPSDFAEQVAPITVIEQEVLEKIRTIDDLKLDMEGLLENIPLLEEIPNTFDSIKQKLQEILNHLYEFNTTSSTNYDTAIQLAENITKGLAQLKGGKGFNSKTGTFSTKGMDLSWAAKLDEIHYTRKAKEYYGNYLKKYPEDLQKVITILKYEETHTKYINQTNEFLTPLEEKDKIEIKYLMYTCEEPYRTLAIRYLDKFKITDTNIKGIFDSNDHTVKFNISEDRIDPRGKYYTFFHEVGHAIDYYYGIENGFKGFYSDSYTIDGKTLNDLMYKDAEANIKSELQKELHSPDHDHLSSEQKAKMINSITNNLLNQNKYSEKLSEEERELQETLRKTYEDKLDGPDHNTASDVYGGVTNHIIRGEYGHEDDYWINIDGKRIREPNGEGFAEYYGRIMTPDGETRDAGIKSIEQFLPESKQRMDKMFKFME